MQVAFGEYWTASLMRLVTAIPWDKSPGARKLSKALLQSSVSINNFMPGEDIPYNQEDAIYKLKTPKGTVSHSVKSYNCEPCLCEYFD